jgi:hypothetical protein
MGYAMSDRRDSLLALCLFALLFSLYLLTFSGIYHSSDEMSMLVVTDSLARRGAWDVELLRWMGEQQGSFGPDGHLYSRKGIGMTLAALPHYWLALQVNQLGNVQTAMLTNGVVTALTGMLVYLLLRRLRYGENVALGVALAFGLGTMAWPYARYFFSESLAGLGLLLSAYFLIRYRDRCDWASPLLAGAGLGVALLARLNNAIAALFLGLLLLFYLYRCYGRNLRRWVEPILLFGLPVLAALVLSGWYNWLRFGNPLSTGYLPEERYATPFLQGLYGLTFSPGKGLFWYNPLFFAALIAWPAFFRRHRAEALMVAAVALSGIVFYAPWYLWWAGHAWGPRFLVTILPFAALPLAAALEAAARRRSLAVGLGVLAAISVAVQMLGVAVNFNLYLEEIYAELGLYHPATLFDPAYSPLLRQMAYLSLENLDLAWAGGGAIDWLALLLGMFAVVVSGFALVAARRWRPSIWTGAGLLALLALVAARLLSLYASTGDVAQAADTLAAMERPGEVAALTEPQLTELFQDAYDGHLWVWGVSSTGEIDAEHEATWAIGEGDPDPVRARFQIGAVQLNYYSPPGPQFDSTRLPGPPLDEKATLGETIRLIAVQLEQATVQPGEMLAVVLYWRTVAAMDTSYTVTVQVIDEDQVKAGQADRLPCYGGCPTTIWRPGDLVAERYDLTITAETVPGHYQIIAGMYDLATGETLTWRNAEGRDLGPYLPLGMVEVQP